MPEERFAALRRQLQQAGVARRHADRISTELSEHFEDLRTEAEADGRSGPAAARFANRCLGSDLDIVAATAARPELLCFSARYPFLYRASRPAVLLLMAPVMPVVNALEHSAVLSRWFYATLLGGTFTATMLFLLQLTIMIH